MTLDDARAAAGAVETLTPSQCLELLAQLPVDLQPIVHEIMRGMWSDGFGCGAARLPRSNPCDPKTPSELPTKPHHTRPTRGRK